MHLFSEGTFQFAQSISTSCIQFMRTKMDSMYHVYFSCCHPRQSSAMNMFHHLTEVYAKFDVT